MSELTQEEIENVKNTQSVLAAQYVYIHIAASSYTSLRNQMFCVEPNFDEDKSFYINIEDVPRILSSISSKAITTTKNNSQISKALAYLLDMKGILAFIDNGVFKVREVRPERMLDDKKDVLLSAKDALKKFLDDEKDKQITR